MASSRREIMEDGRQKPVSYLITTICDELPAVADEEVLVILGLAKPYRGSSCQYKKMRCYILAIGSVASTGYRPLSRFRPFCPSPPPPLKLSVVKFHLMALQVATEIKKNN